MPVFDSIRFVRNNETIYKMLINGQWIEASDTFEVKSPADGSSNGSGAGRPVGF
jgi:hypothetical protein